MDNKEICDRLRRDFTPGGLALLIYHGIMEAAIFLALGIDLVIRFASHDSSNGFTAQDILQILSSTAGNGWGYVVATLLGAVLLFLWKKREFCFRTIWQKEKPISVSSLLAVFAIFVSTQAFAQLFATGLEWFLNLFGLSALGALDSASQVEDTVSMFLYSALLGPVFEEIIFRGLLLRSMQKYGKKFAIFASAFLFGIFHANAIQTPYAFCVGLVLGYVAVEYSMVWSIALHVFNNLVIVDLMTRFSKILPPGVGDLISLILIWGCAIAAVVILIVKGKAVVAYFREKKIHPLCLKAFFTSPGILAITIFMVFNMLMVFLLQQFM